MHEEKTQNYDSKIITIMFRITLTILDTFFLNFKNTSIQNVDSLVTNKKLTKSAMELL